MTNNPNAPGFTRAVRYFLRHGNTVDQVIALLSKDARERALRDDWRPSELAMTVASYELQVPPIAEAYYQELANLAAAATDGRAHSAEIISLDVERQKRR